eukprot:SAG31_NODE_41_length_31342_cov_8.029286_28_plen_74_part_00
MSRCWQVHITIDSIILARCWPLVMRLSRADTEPLEGRGWFTNIPAFKCRDVNLEGLQQQSEFIEYMYLEVCQY